MPTKPLQRAHTRATDDADAASAMAARRAQSAGQPRVFTQGSGLGWASARRKTYVEAAQRALAGEVLTDAERAVLFAEMPASVTTHHRDR